MGVKSKRWYGFHVNIPLIYIPFLIGMMLLKYYSRKLFNRIRNVASPNITLLIQNQPQGERIVDSELSGSRPRILRSRSF